MELGLPMIACAIDMNCWTAIDIKVMIAIAGPSTDVFQTTVGWSDAQGLLHSGEAMLLRARLVMGFSMIAMIIEQFFDCDAP